MRALYIVVAGEPLPLTRELRGSFAALIRGACGECWRGPWREFDMRGSDVLPDLDDVAGFIITGSSASATSREPWMLRGEKYFERAVAGGTPVLGICFGHQLLGQALGGRVEKNPNGREIGTVELTLLRTDPLLDSQPEPLLVNTTHVDSVVELPPGSQILARTALEPHAVLRFAERAYGVQFHPEVDGEVMLHYLDSRRELLAEEGLDPDELRGAACDAPGAAAMLRRFVAMV